MAVVTDKKYHIDGYMKERLDFFIERGKKGWDNLLLVDGDEGDGKSTAAIGWAYYVAHTKGVPFSAKNVFFDIDEMSKYAARTSNQVIVWDEAALGGMGQDWQGRTQKKLIKILMIARKKGHFWIFVIPKVRRLKDYFVLERAVGLAHVYTPDGLTRGSFSFYKRENMRKLYIGSYKTRMPNYKYYASFIGKYVEKGFVIDRQKYEAKKDKAIIETASDIGEEKEDKNYIKLQELKRNIALNENFTDKQKADLCGCAERTINYWKKIEHSPAEGGTSDSATLQKEAILIHSEEEQDQNSPPEGNQDQNDDFSGNEAQNKPRSVSPSQNGGGLS